MSPLRQKLEEVDTHLQALKVLLSEPDGVLDQSVAYEQLHEALQRAQNVVLFAAAHFPVLKEQVP